MPKIVRFHRLGGPETLQFDELPQQQPGAGEARLKVQAIGLNRAESMFYHGEYRSSRLASATRLRALSIPSATAWTGNGSANPLPRFRASP